MQEEPSEGGMIPIEMTWQEVVEILLSACRLALGAIPPECGVTRNYVEQAIKKVEGA
jgi:hypothetical protein